jgi:hypothetical protein
MLVKGKFQAKIPLYLWKAETSTCVNLDLGKVCKDEIMEISFDNFDSQQRHFRYSDLNSSDTNQQHQRHESKSDLHQKNKSPIKHKASLSE